MATTNTTTTNGSQSWICKAPIPNMKTNRRETCSAINALGVSVCHECGAPRDFRLTDNSSNIKNSSTNKDKNMSTTVKPATSTQTTDKSKNTAKPVAATPDTAKPAPAVAIADAATTKSATDTTPRPTPDPTKPETYKGLPRIRFYSATKGKEEYCVRILPIFLDRHGVPKDPWGLDMVQRTSDAPGSVSKKAQRIEAKDAEKAKIAAMTDDEKLAYARAKREANVATKEAKKKAQREEMMAALKKELEQEGMAIVPKTTAA